MMKESRAVTSNAGFASGVATLDWRLFLAWGAKILVGFAHARAGNPAIHKIRFGSNPLTGAL